MKRFLKVLFFNTARKVVRGFSRSTGIEISRPHDGGRTKDFELVRPRAGYAPWLLDHGFTRVFEQIQNNTLVDRYRCYELWELLPQVSHLPGAIIEVGVWRGGTGALIASRIRESDKNCAIYLCDTFCGVVKSGEKDNGYVDGEHSDTSVDLVQQLLRKLKIEKCTVLKGTFPEDVEDIVKGEKFKFCHLDVDTYQSLRDCFDFLWGRITVGGVLLIDDYGFVGCSGARIFVEEVRYQDDLLFIHNLNGHAIFVKTR